AWLAAASLAPQSAEAQTRAPSARKNAARPGAACPGATSYFLRATTMSGKADPSAATTARTAAAGGCQSSGKPAARVSARSPEETAAIRLRVRAAEACA